MQASIGKIYKWGSYQTLNIICSKSSRFKISLKCHSTFPCCSQSPNQINVFHIILVAYTAFFILKYIACCWCGCTFDFTFYRMTIMTKNKRCMSCDHVVCSFIPKLYIFRSLISITHFYDHKIQETISSPLL